MCRGRRCMENICTCPSILLAVNLKLLWKKKRILILKVFQLKLQKEYRSFGEKKEKKSEFSFAIDCVDWYISFIWPAFMRSPRYAKHCKVLGPQRRYHSLPSKKALQWLLNSVLSLTVVENTRPYGNPRKSFIPT